MSALRDTGVWVDFSYADHKSYPKVSRSYLVKGHAVFTTDVEIEYIALWDDVIKCFDINQKHYFITKWLLED